MRKIAAVLAAALLVAGSAGAQTQAGKQKPYHKRNAQNYAGGNSAAYAAPRRDNGYVEYYADRMPFGSSAWWEQMRREGRLGGETP
jgi:hypothetical protein